MDNLMLRRRAILSFETGEDLYPIGTDICDYYNFKSTGEVGKTILSSNGEIGNISGTSHKTSENYAEINPAYTYAKKYYRLYVIAFYDQSYTFIRSTGSLNTLTDGQVLTNIPSNAKYVRIDMYNAKDDPENVGLVRIA